MDPLQFAGSQLPVSRRAPTYYPLGKSRVEITSARMLVRREKRRRIRSRCATGIAKWGYTNESTRSSSSWHASPCISVRSSLNLADFHSNIKDDDESLAGQLIGDARGQRRLVEKKRRNYYPYYISVEAKKVSRCNEPCLRPSRTGHDYESITNESIANYFSTQYSLSAFQRFSEECIVVF